MTVAEKLTLRPYQTGQLGAIATSLLVNRQNRILVKSPTGTGKTVMFSAIPTHEQLKPWLDSHQPKTAWMLVLAHREELLEQAAAKIQAANPNLLVCIDQGERRGSAYADVVVMSIQTAQAMKFRRLKAYLKQTTFRIVIVDEAHHSAAPTYRTALALLGFLPMADASDVEDAEAATHDDVAVMQEALAGWDRVAPQDRVLIGVTATPNRSDAVGLGCVFQTLAYSYDLKQAIADNWLVPIASWSVETATSLEEVRIQRGDFNQRELADAVNNAKRNQLALAAWRQHADGLSTLGFTVDVAHAHAMAQLFNEAGIPSVAISGETPKEERRASLAAYTRGEILVIFNCMVLTEGTDLPRTGCILHLKPTKSATLYEQMTGRGLRLFPGKTECIVIDLVDLSRRHSLQAAPVLYGLPPSLITKGEKLGDVEAKVTDMIGNLGLDVNELLDGKRLTLEQLGALARKVDVWNIPSIGEFGKKRRLMWVRVDENTYRVQYPWSDGNEAIEVTKNLLDTFDVVITMMPKEGPKRQRTIAAQVTDEDSAADLAEAFINQERQSVLRLKDRTAGWMRNPMTSKQEGLLKSLGIKAIPKGVTAGEASQMIEIAKARKARR